MSFEIELAANLRYCSISIRLYKHKRLQTCIWRASTTIMDPKRWHSFSITLTLTLLLPYSPGMTSSLLDYPSAIVEYFFAFDRLVFFGVPFIAAVAQTTALYMSTFSSPNPYFPETSTFLMVTFSWKMKIGKFIC